MSHVCYKRCMGSKLFSQMFMYSKLLWWNILKFYFHDCLWLKTINWRYNFKRILIIWEHLPTKLFPGLDFKTKLFGLSCLSWLGALEATCWEYQALMTQTFFTATRLYNLCQIVGLHYQACSWKMRLIWFKRRKLFSPNHKSLINRCKGAYRTS